MFFDYQLDMGYQQVIANIQETMMHRSAISRVTPLPSTGEYPFSSIAEYTNDCLCSAGAIENRIPDHWAAKKSLNGKFLLRARQWQVYAKRPDKAIHLATARSVYIQSSKNEIINTWLFPTNCSSTPVFAAELISISGVHRVAFIDIQTPGASEALQRDVHQSSAALAARFSVLPFDEPPPNWATQDSTGNYAFARNAGSQWTNMITDCYRSYLNHYVKIYVMYPHQKSNEESPSTESNATLTAYQQHHMHSSPGKKFLENLFSPEWTQDFMDGFLFTLAKE